MNLADYRRRLHTSLLVARTIGEAREIQAELARVDRVIAIHKQAWAATNDPTGRIADLSYLRREFDRAPNRAIRANIARAASVIHNESEKQRRLRREMIHAQRSGNRNRAREIGEHLHVLYG